MSVFKVGVYILSDKTSKTFQLSLQADYWFLKKKKNAYEITDNFVLPIWMCFLLVEQYGNIFPEHNTSFRLLQIVNKHPLDIFNQDQLVISEECWRHLEEEIGFQIMPRH